MKRYKAIFGVFRTKAEAERATDGLRAEGFTDTEVSFLMPNPTPSAAPSSSGTLDPDPEAPVPGGMTTGALIGETLGLLTGIGALAIPGIGPFLAAGPLMAALAGFGVGATVGGLSGALIRLGLPELDARRLESFVTEGAVLLAVHVEDEASLERSRGVLKGAGASEISVAFEGQPVGEMPAAEVPHAPGLRFQEDGRDSDRILDTNIR